PAPLSPPFPYTTLFRSALQLAGEAGHDGLAAWIYGEQAYNAIYAGQPERAVALARAGQELAPAGSVSAVRLLAWEAWGLARTGRSEEHTSELQSPDHLV